MGARAIAVSSLLQLKDFKAGKMSSMHFLCATLWRMDDTRDAAEKLSRELDAVDRVKDVQIQNLLTATRNFERDAEIVNSELRNFPHEYVAGDGEELADMGEALEDPEQIRGTSRERLARLRRLTQIFCEKMKEDVAETA